jgi:enoyl-CoA hydratase/carnithine racemase
MTDDIVMLEKDETGQIATLWLNRTEKLNAINYAMFNKLSEHTDALSQDTEVRVVLLKGKGPHFSSGIDLNTLSGQDPEAPKFKLLGTSLRYLITGLMQPIYQKLSLLEIPIIAVIDGYCFGAGFELTLVADFRFATDSAIFQMVESRLGVIPDLGGTTRLCRLTNPSFAKDVVLSGRRVSAKEGYRMGFLNEIAPNMEELEENVMYLAGELIKAGPLAVGMGKRLVDAVYGVSEADGLIREGLVNSALLTSKDFTRGVSSFFTKKQPKWTGK